MAAYAALVSLENLMEQIQIHTRRSISLHKEQIESLSEKVSFLQEFIEKYSHILSKEAEILETQIASAAYAAEDVIESHIVDQIHGGSFSLLDLQNVIEEMDHIKGMCMKFKENRGFRDLLPTYSFSANNSTRSLTIERNIMVGFDEKLIQIMDELTVQQSSRRIVSIVGMGGIGKTTLARNVYENALIVQKFHIRAWVTVSQHYNVKEILLKLLIFLREQHERELDRQSEDQLGEKLYKILSGRMYLIILDDMWSMEAWDMIKKFLPDNNNRSRIVMNLLNEKESWRLFCETVFAEEGCPPELEEIGEQNYDIRVSRLIKLWVAEGFLKPSKIRSLEEVAEDYVRDLVDRNLIFVRRLGSNGKTKTCYVHDLLRDACLRVAGREKFLCVMRVLNTARRTDKERRIIFHESIPKKDHDLPVFHALRSASFARSLICAGGQLPYKFRLLRVLTVVDDDSLETIFRQVNLRYLSYEHLLFSYSNSLRRYPCCGMCKR
ncbi:putative late blight resistance protein homolog r1a-3 [Phtheirospermum japonicum]|uniref:Putative late blight resistance protein homolog r1a-3 n=1 Tax=Phtheirospermum japonicum TaxID=374723 RepID=A0A830D3W9_9LAMI|nr:putative late blight resistance protein homolog r1a-3 [Phtheirospermum japonicum]